MADNHTRAYEAIKDIVEFWWNGNITRLELVNQISQILVIHEVLEGGH